MDTPPDRSETNRPSRTALALCVLAFALLAGSPIGLRLALAGEGPESSSNSGAATMDSPDAGSEASSDASSDAKANARPHSSPDAGSSRETGPRRGRPSPSAEKLLEEAGAITEQVARIRGLPALETIDKGVKNREQLRKLLVAKLKEEQSIRQMRREAAVLRELGLIPQKLDYRETILDVLTEQIAGFYDQESDELNIMVGIPLDLQRPAMAHEIFHAIQDQHFDLTQMMEPFSARENGDFHLARSALVEGDATVLMIDYTLYQKGTLPRKEIRSIVDIPMMANMLEQLQYGELGALEKLDGGQQGGGSSSSESSKPAAGQPAALSSTALDEAPSIVRRTLIFPYLAGMRFVIAMRSDRSWREFNEIYDGPPVSTEQILHPRRYAERDEPVILEYDAGAVLESYEPIYDTVLGEFQMRLFLQHHAGESGARSGDREIDAVRAAAGWDGDRLHAFRGEDGDVVVTHLSVWDSTKDAVEYYNALVEINERRFSDATTHTASGEHGASVCMHHGSGDSQERAYVERWGDAVLHIEGAPSELDSEGDERNPTTYLLREQIWQSTERRPFREVYRQRMAEKDQNETKD